ncbi:MlaD family protein [Rhodospirillaceae bacterium SYSU D60014]|uniref:MlaD family protein n=1 Tax=Virgifigura deserti TaxID=2268457 RepID=UPI000E6671D9
METRASYVAVGSFVLILVAGLVGFIIWLGKVQGQEDFAFYDVLFEGAVTNLQVGSAVRYRGLAVGRVVDMRIDDEDIDRVRVTIQVKPDTPIRTNTVASLEYQGITGVAYVQLTGGAPAGEPLPERTQPPYPVIASKPSQLAQLFEGAPDLVTSLNALVDRVTLLFSDRNRQAIDETLRSLQLLTTTLARDTGGLNQVLTDGAAAADQVRMMAAEFERLASDARGQLNSVGGEAEATIAELQETADSFSAVASEIELLVHDSRAPIRDFTASGLYELTQLITETRLLVASLSRVSSQIERDPARFFFGDRSRGFEAQ